VHLTLGQQGRRLRSEEGGEKEGGDEESQSGAQSEERGSGGSREPRARGLSRRGRGSWASDRPPAVLWVERGGQGRVIELQSDVTQRTLTRSTIEHVKPGSRIDTDDFSGYRLLKGAYDHKTVDHEETYVTEEGTHCNTAEGEWSIFKPWWRRFRGVAKRHAYRYLSEYSFRRSHREEPRQKRLRRMVALLKSPAGGAGRGNLSAGLY
jgi:transposase-like protein